jgi:hypothetical protein
VDYQPRFDAMLDRLQQVQQELALVHAENEHNKKLLLHIINNFITVEKS